MNRMLIFVGLTTVLTTFVRFVFIFVDFFGWSFIINVIVWSIIGVIGFWFLAIGLRYQEFRMIYSRNKKDHYKHMAKKYSDSVINTLEDRDK